MDWSALFGVEVPLIELVLPEGVVLVGTLVAWNLLLDWAGYRWTWFHWLAQPAPVLLVRRGIVLQRNLRREMLRRSDLLAMLREQGIDDVSKVKWA